MMKLRGAAGLASTAAFVLIASAATTFGQKRGGAAKETSAPSPSCIRQFYDPQEYNWLSFQNKCSQAITLEFVSKRRLSSKVYDAGSMDLRPGHKDSTGFSRNEVNKMGGFDIYVCPLHYTAVDANGRPIETPNAPYHCAAP